MSYISTMHTISIRRFFRCLYRLFRTFPTLTIILSMICFHSFSSAQSTKWVGTWSTASQLVEPGNNPPSPGLSNNTLRQIVRVSLGGDTLRMRFAVLNEGIGGNCVLGACLGSSALSRFERDVLNQNGVRWVIIFEGINDIGYGAPGVGNNLINAYTQMIYSAQANGIFVYGATLLPFGGSFYDSEAHETERQIVNEWIRNGGLFDESQTIYFEPECATVGESWNMLNDAQASNGKYLTIIC